MKQRTFLRNTIGVCLAATSCADGATAPEKISAIEIPLTCIEIQSTSSCQLVSKVMGAKGSILADRPVVWTSTDTSILKVSASGLVTAQINRSGANKPGTINATAEGKSASLTIGVQPAPIAKIEIIEGDTLAFPGDSIRMQAVLLSSTNDTLYGRTIQYFTSDSTIGTVRTAPWILLKPYTGASSRSLTVVISAEAKQAVNRITVQALIPTNIKLTVTDTIQKSGARAALFATVRDARGTALTGHNPTISSSDTTIATIIGNSTAVFSQNRGVTPRRTTLSLTLNTLRDSVPVVLLPEEVEQVALAIEKAELESRETTRLQTRVSAADGTELFGRVVNYLSTDTSVASVNADGVVSAKPNRGTSMRTTTLSATAGTKITSLTASVKPAPVAAIALRTPTVNPYPGDTLILESLFLSPAADTLVGRSATYTSSDTSIAQVTTQGIISIAPYYGNETRTAVIIAQNGTISAFTSFGVRPLPAAAITYSRDTIVLGPEETQSLEYTVTSAKGHPLTGRTPTFTVLDTTVVRIINGVLIAKKHTNLAAKSTQAIAELGTLRDTLVVIVESKPASTIVPNRDTIVLYPSQRDTVKVTIFDATGQRLEGRSVEWTSADTTVATVQGGIIVAKPFGGNVRRSTTVTALTLGATRTVVVSVNPARVRNIQLEPSAVELFPGDTITLRPRITDEVGTILFDRRLIWTSSRADVAVVDSTGLVTIPVGTATNVTAVAISAAFDGLSGMSSVAVKPISDDKAVVEVTMNWDVINSTDQAGLSVRSRTSGQSMSTGSNPPLADNTLPTAITHVGARLIYPAENAAFSQSTTRLQAETKGVITLEVPPTDSAVLWVVFANETGPSPSILRFGFKQKVRIERGKRLEIPIDSLIITSATWRIPGADSARLYRVDSIAQNRDSTFHNLWIEATDPFQISQSPTESQRVISFSGSGGFGPNVGGWRRIRISSRNPRIGISHRDSTYTFQPYVVGTFFNLTGTRYHFGPQGKYRPFWDSFNAVSVANPSLTSVTLRFADSALVSFSPRDASGGTYLTPRTVVWTSSDTTIAIGRNTGYILGRRAGTAVLTYTLGGNGGATGQVSVTVLASGRVAIPINWTKINENRAIPITTVGARITYRNRNVTYSKSITRTSGAPESSLELSEVAVSDSATLWLVYANEKILPSGAPDHTAQLFSVSHHFRVAAGETVTILPDTITQITPSWRIPNTDDARLYTIDSLYANRDNSFHYLDIEASDPFQSGENPIALLRAVRFSGTGSELGNVTGWRTFRITSRNPKVGVTHRDATYTFRPYVASEFFDLPTANRYHFGAQGRFQPYWVQMQGVRFVTSNRQPTVVIGQQQTYLVEAVATNGMPLAFRATFSVSDTAAISLVPNSAGTTVTINTVKGNYQDGAKTVKLIAQYGLLRDSLMINLVALGSSTETAKAVTFGLNIGCAIDKSDKIRCWGTNSNSGLGAGQPVDTTLQSIPRLIAINESFRDVKAGLGDMVCGLTNDGDAYCWGKVTGGSLGDGLLQQSSTPVRVQSQVKFKEIAVTSNSGSPNGQGAACGLDIDGNAWCWGANSFGELGDSTQSARVLPVRVKQSEPYRSIAAFLGVCGIGKSGAVYCWGNRNYAGNGDTTNTIRSVPQRVIGLDSSVVKIATGGSQVCALMRSGAAYCWGAGGRIGDGTAVRGGTATLVQFSGSFIDLAHRSTVTCGLSTDSKVYCWGINSSGQAGTGVLSSGNQLIPTLGAGNLSYSKITSGNNAGCGQRGDGSWFCWGQNTGGKLGDGTRTSRPSPIALPIP